MYAFFKIYMGCDSYRSSPISTRQVWVAPGQHLGGWEVGSRHSKACRVGFSAGSLVEFQQENHRKSFGFWGFFKKRNPFQSKFSSWWRVKGEGWSEKNGKDFDGFWWILRFYLTNLVRRIHFLNLSMFVYVLVWFAFRNEIIPECHGKKHQMFTNLIVYIYIYMEIYIYIHCPFCANMNEFRIY